MLGTQLLSPVEQRDAEAAEPQSAVARKLSRIDFVLKSQMGELPFSEMDHFAGFENISRHHAFTEVGDATMLELIADQDAEAHLGWLSYLYKFGFGAAAWTAVGHLFPKDKLATLFSSEVLKRFGANAAVGVAGSVGAAIGLMFWELFHRDLNSTAKWKALLHINLNLLALVFPFDAFWQTAFTPWFEDFSWDRGYVCQAMMFTAASAMSLGLYFGLKKCIPQSGQIPLSGELFTAFALGGLGFSAGTVLAGALSAPFIPAILMNGVMTAAFAQIPALMTRRHIQQKQLVRGAVQVLNQMYEQAPEQVNPNAPAIPGVTPYTKADVIFYIRHSLAKLQYAKVWNRVIAAFRVHAPGSEILTALNASLETHPLHAVRDEHDIQGHGFVGHVDTSHAWRKFKARLDVFRIAGGGVSTAFGHLSQQWDAQAAAEAAQEM